MRRLLKPAVMVTAVVVAAAALDAQTPVKLPKNNFTPQQDVEIGLKGAAEIRLVTILARARLHGFDTITIVEIAGDGRKAVGHLLLDGEASTALELGRRFGASAR